MYGGLLGRVCSCKVIVCNMYMQRRGMNIGSGHWLQIGTPHEISFCFPVSSSTHIEKCSDSMLLLTDYTVKNDRGTQDQPWSQFATIHWFSCSENFLAPTCTCRIYSVQHYLRIQFVRMVLSLLTNLAAKLLDFCFHNSIYCTSQWGRSRYG